MSEFIDSIKNNFDYCSDCGVFRYKPPKPGTCPCCFSEMSSEINNHSGYKVTIRLCTNDDCKRVCTNGYLTGFWSGWKQKERQVNSEEK